MSIDPIRTTPPLPRTEAGDAAAPREIRPLATTEPAQVQTLHLDPLVYPPGIATWAQHGQDGHVDLPDAQPTGGPSGPAPAPPQTNPLEDPTLAPLLAQSPTLQGDIARLQQEGYTVKWGTAGKGTYIDEGRREIVIDANSQGNGPQIAQSLAHETGHQKFAEPEDRSSKEALVHVRLRDEAAATINNARVRQEILAAGGPDIGFPGIHSAQYKEITDRLLSGQITEDQALNEIAEVFKTEKTSTTGQTYEEYYGQEWTPADEARVKVQEAMDKAAEIANEVWDEIKSWF